LRRCLCCRSCASSIMIWNNNHYTVYILRSTRLTYLYLTWGHFFFSRYPSVALARNLNVKGRGPTVVGPPPATFPGLHIYKLGPMQTDLVAADYLCWSVDEVRRVRVRACGCKIVAEPRMLLCRPRSTSSAASNGHRLSCCHMSPHFAPVTTSKCTVRLPRDARMQWRVEH